MHELFLSAAKSRASGKSADWSLTRLIGPPAPPAAGPGAAALDRPQVVRVLRQVAALVSASAAADCADGAEGTGVPESGLDAGADADAGHLVLQLRLCHAGRSELTLAQFERVLEDTVAVGRIAGARTAGEKLDSVRAGGRAGGRASERASG